MKAVKTIPEQVDVEHSISSILFSLTHKTAQVNVHGGPAVNGGAVDLTPIIAALSDPDKAVIKAFMKDIIAVATGVTVGELTGEAFEPDA